jgi:hypothetical protein
LFPSDRSHRPAVHPEPLVREEWKREAAPGGIPRRRPQ